MNRVKNNGICYEINFGKSTAEVVYSPEAKGDLVIPRSVQYLNHEYKIIKICKYSFKNNNSIKSISFSKDSEISVIERYAFYNSSIEKLSIPTSLEKLEGGWESYATKLKQITVSQFNRNFLFQDDNFIFSKTLKRSKIYDVFNYCSNKIQSVTIPSSIKRIESYAFCRCDNINSIEFPENSKVAIICDYAFSGTSIESIFIPASVTEIHYAAFSFCSELKTVIFTETSKLKTIEKAVFYESFIENITIPPNVEIINEETFIECNHLRSVSFSKESELKSIKKNSISSQQITSIMIPSNVEEIEESFCISSPNLSRFYIEEKNENFKFIDDTFLLGKSNPGQSCFDVILFVANKSFLNEISIPNYIARIGEKSFSNSKRLKSIEFQSNSRVKSIGKKCFENTFIEKIIIPSTVEYIEDESFCECKNLKTIEFSGNSKLKKIGRFAFFNCSIECIKIPSSVEVIERSAFFLCTKLSTVIFEEDSRLELIDDESFYITGLTSIKIPSKVKRIGKKAFSSCTKLQSIEISEYSNLESIGTGCFQSTSIKSIYIPPKFNNFEDGVFDKLALTDFSISSLNQNYSIYENKFLLGKSKDNENENEYSFDVLLTVNHNIRGEVIIPSFIKFIGSHAFQSCEKVHSLKFAEETKIKSIGDFSFNCIQFHRV